MSVVYVEDKGGKPMTLKEMKGRHYPTFPLDSLKHTTEIEARHDDILLITYPKSGTHWVFEIIRFLLAGTTNLPIIEKDLHMLEWAERDFINGLPLDTPRNINTHFHADALSPDFLRKKSKIIYVTRNPRDVVTSFFHHHKRLDFVFEYYGEWNDYLPTFLEGKLDYDSWFEHTKGWEKYIKDHPDNPFLVLSYEGLKQDAFGSIKKMSDFIGMKHNETFLKEVVVKTSFDSMQGNRKNNGENRFLGIYRKGHVGDWKNNFTVAQSEIFDAIFEKEMAGTDVYKLYSRTVEKVHAS